ncbi:MAG: NAD(+)/NADH kinase [Phycisphaerales bacterium]|nr:NAD(+)/NADH kinase [Phycisphaerales bacterium]
MKRRVALITNRKKPRAAEALALVRGQIESYGELVAQLQTGEQNGLPDPGEVDLVIALGGDGTILAAAHKCLALRVPLLGVNTGKVGFMAGYELDRFCDAAPRLLGDAPLNIQQVTPLHGIVRNEHGTPIFSSFALNEFVVSAGPPFRMITLDISVDEQVGPRVSGDGIIVSTPLGSTAYNVSAGGPIVAPGVNAMTVTPIAAHSLSFRPIVIPSSSEVAVRVCSANTSENSGTTLIIDGQFDQRLGSGDVLRVTAAKEQIGFVLDERVSYWKTLLGKMHWASEPNAQGIKRRF